MDMRETESQTKRKRQDRNISDIHLSQSLSQFSISANSTKKMKSKTKDNQKYDQIFENTIDNTNKREQEEQNDIFSAIHSIEAFKPNFLEISDETLKELLVSELQNGDNIIEHLDTSEKLQFVREMTDATNTLYYIDVQRQLWQTYYDVSTHETTFTSSTPTSLDGHYHSCYLNELPITIVEQQLKTSREQLQYAINQLQEYLLNLEEHVKHWKPYIHPSVLSNIINECVKRVQQPLRAELDYRKKMITINAKDHHWTSKFYELQPNVAQVCEISNYTFIQC